MLLLAEATRVRGGIAPSASLAEEDFTAWAAWAMAVAAIKKRQGEEQL